MAVRRSTKRSGRQIKDLPELFVERILPGAAKAGGLVIADAAKQLLGTRRAETGSGAKVLIADSVKVKVRRNGSIITARVTLIGPGAYVGRWLEYGTSGHFITVAAEAREGRTARRINRQIAAGDEQVKASLFINGKPVGPSVYHPGAKPHPFLRPASDNNEDAAKGAALAYMAQRVTKAGINVAEDPEIDR